MRLDKRFGLTYTQIALISPSVLSKEVIFRKKADLGAIHGCMAASFAAPVFAELNAMFNPTTFLEDR
jgi:hypothetical protein